ncbi:glycoside hydrolase family 43 protein [Pedobacter ghigonis]|uniref:glycoside hydrolase family 43 protein n=1 Tax=Pedobacter ghigonis TaxID=2730403 RepID=UPI00158E8C6C|nr:glycoside hydrolase 43 family protein [Pedobacter ghigonis]
MKNFRLFKLSLLFLLPTVYVHAQQAENPIIFADVPDPSMIRVGKAYYMSSTTMHMNPGVPIMKSTDLTNWKIVSYAYDTLGNADELTLSNGKWDYGRGSWASSLRFHKGVYYLSTFSGTTGKTYIYRTKDIEKGPWKLTAFAPSLHDHSLFFDEGKAYMVYGAGKIMLAELKEDLSGIKPDVKPVVIIENASLAAGPGIGLPAEGSQLFKIKGKYYLFNITWPRNGMRTVVVHRSDRLSGPYEGRVALKDKGVAQGGLISTPKGKWFAYLFRDFGSVGRIPYLVPVSWENEWPVFGIHSKVPEILELPVSRGLIPGIVASDEFDRKKASPVLPLVWQWNHNPDNTYWSLTNRTGFLRITTSRLDTNILLARNTLTQRTIGPKSTAITSVDISNMKTGDRAGLMLLQRQFGWVGVKHMGEKKTVVMVSAQNGTVNGEDVPAGQRTIYLKASCDFEQRTDRGNFFYSLDGKTWKPIGESLQMTYTLPHFMGYRFALFNYATQDSGGYVDFDYFRIHLK